MYLNLSHLNYIIGLLILKICDYDNIENGGKIFTPLLL